MDAFTEDIIQQALSPDDSRYRIFSRDSRIDYETIDWISKQRHASQAGARLFEKVDNKDPAVRGKKLQYEKVCESCGSLFWVVDSKSSFNDYVSYVISKRNPTKKSITVSKEKLLCTDCLKKHKESKQEVSRERKDVANRIREQETRFYLDNVCDPSAEWISELTHKERWRVVNNVNIDHKEVSEYLRGLPYTDFLDTPYWKAVSQRAKYLAGFRCQLCDDKGQLQTHHRHYRNHGMEHLHIREMLIVLCRDCHSTFHGVSE